VLRFQRSAYEPQAFGGMNVKRCHKARSARLLRARTTSIESHPAPKAPGMAESWPSYLSARYSRASISLIFPRLTFFSLSIAQAQICADEIAEHSDRSTFENSISVTTSRPKAYQ